MLVVACTNRSRSEEQMGQSHDADAERLWSAVRELFAQQEVRTTLSSLMVGGRVNTLLEAIAPASSVSERCSIAAAAGFHLQKGSTAEEIEKIIREAAAIRGPRI